MQFQFSFKHMATSESLQNYAQEKITERVQKFVTKPIEAHVIFTVQKHQHFAHASLHAGDGFSMEVEATSEDMYASIDLLVDKLAVQLKKHKEKLKDHKQPKLSQSIQAITESEPAIDAAEVLKYEQARRRQAAN